MKSNPHIGTSFDSFLDEAGIREDVHAEAQKRLEQAEAERLAAEADFNGETRAVLRDSERGADVARFDSAEALYEDLGLADHLGENG